VNVGSAAVNPFDDNRVNRFISLLGSHRAEMNFCNRKCAAALTTAASIIAMTIAVGAHFKRKISKGQRFREVIEVRGKSFPTNDSRPTDQLSFCSADRGVKVN
jgi:hypothetical protein